MTKRLGLTARSLIIGIAASVFLAFWSQYSELIIHGTQITLTYPPIGGFFVFLCIYVVFNILLRKLHHSLALSRTELVVVFTMIVMASGIASIDLAQKLIPMIVGPFYYATPENHYGLYVLPNIADWMAPRDPRVVTGLFEGSRLGVPLNDWLVPLGAWTAFTLATYMLMMSVITIFRRQWVNRERLLFPLVAVPLEVIEPAPRARMLNDFFRNPFMWAGLIIAFGLHFYNALHAYYPSLPMMQVLKIGGKPVPTYAWGKPWSAIGTIRFQVQPLVIGLSYLLTREVSFSLWAFYWLGRVEAVAGAAVGLDGLSTIAGGDSFPFPGLQTAGAYLGLVAVSIWIARKPLAEVVISGLTFRKNPDEDDEPMSYRVAVWGGILSFIFLLVWCNYAGMPLSVSVVLLVVAFAYLLAMTRLVSEGGMPWLDEPHWRAHDVIRSIFPYRSLTVANWTSVAMLLAFTQDMRVSPMPRLMQSLKMTEETGTSNRHLTIAIAVAAIVAIPFSFYALLQAGYGHGGVAINPYRFVNLARASGSFMERIDSAQLKQTDWISVALLGYGALKLVGLSFMRVNYLWWPLHPVGYSMSYIVYVGREWLSVLIGWACQTLLMHYGGAGLVAHHRRRHRPARPQAPVLSRCRVIARRRVFGPALITIDCCRNHMRESCIGPGLVGGRRRC